MELKGAVVVVTCAACGPGRVIAEAFAAQSSRVAMVDVLATHLQRTAAEIRESGGTALAIVADITEASAGGRLPPAPLLGQPR